MKILVSALCAIFLVSGCSTQSAYTPADNSRSYGYSESPLTSNRYRVSYRGNSHTPSDLVKDYALLRSAELTLQQGHDWFKIVSRDVDKQSRRTAHAGISADRPHHVRRDCGLLGCRTSSTIYTGAKVSSTRTTDRYTSSIEILMGSGKPDDPTAVYDARELAQALRKKVADR